MRHLDLGYYLYCDKDIILPTIVGTIVRTIIGTIVSRVTRGYERFVDFVDFIKNLILHFVFIY